MTGMDADARSVELVPWTGPWAEDDPDANFKADVALYARLDPMRTIDNLAEAMGLPPGAVVRYVLAKWASAGSGGLLELGPQMVHRLWEPVEQAEAAGTDDRPADDSERGREPGRDARRTAVAAGGPVQCPRPAPARSRAAVALP
jgi:hypothetical protein